MCRGVRGGGPGNLGGQKNVINLKHLVETQKMHWNNMKKCCSWPKLWFLKIILCLLIQYSQTIVKAHRKYLDLNSKHVVTWNLECSFRIVYHSTNFCAKNFKMWRQYLIFGIVGPYNAVSHIIYFLVLYYYAVTVIFQLKNIFNWNKKYLQLLFQIMMTLSSSEKFTNRWGLKHCFFQHKW